jgi:hypothetical protein
MGYDYELELKFPPPLRIECIKLFQECKEFETPSDLRAFARITQLTLVVECIPSQAQLKYPDLMLSLLRTRNKTTSEPVLFDLLDALADEYQEQARGTRFKELKEEIRSALLQAKGSEQEKEYLRLAEDSAPGDGRGTSEAARRWIEEAGDNLDELALRITLAVFHGTAFEVIERAKKELLEMLLELVPPPPPPDPENPPPVVPHVPLMRRLEKAGAREAEGKPPDWQRVVELERPELAAEAIVYVWHLNRETEWRKRLIEWLTNHAARRAAEVRIRAAVTVGRVAVKDYRFVRDRLLTDWVRKKDPQFRTAIGMALGVLVREDSLAEEVQGLLREWAESTDGAKRWAAMRAYIYVGPYCQPPGEAIARWRRMAASEPVAIDIPVSETEVVRLNNPLHMSLMDAVVKFFFNAAYRPEGERLSLFAGILAELKEWVSSDEENAWLGLFMFATLGQLRVGAAGNGEGGGAPVLLQLVAEGPDEAGYRVQLAKFFEAAMRNGATIIETQELLCAWLDWADKLQDDAQSYEGRIRTLFKEIIAADGGGRMRGKLAACLRDCGRNRVAQSILSTL